MGNRPIIILSHTEKAVKIKKHRLRSAFRFGRTLRKCKYFIRKFRHIAMPNLREYVGQRLPF